MVRQLTIVLGLTPFLIISGSNVKAADLKPEPFQAVLDQNVSAFAPIYSVPSGKRAEVEFLSIRIIHTPAPLPAAGGVYLRVVSTFAGQLMEHSLPLVELSDQQRVASHKILLHADPGTGVFLFPTGGCEGGITCSVRASIAGYLYKN